MKVSVNLKDSDIKKLVKNAIIIVDTREQKNEHIIKYFQDNKIMFEKKALSYGDYSIKINKNDDLGLPFDITLENNVVVERKNGLTELSSNLTTKRNEFEIEFSKANRNNCDIYLAIENSNWSEIWHKQYQTMFNQNSFYNSLIAFRQRYKINIDFIRKEDMGMHIYKILCMYLKKMLDE